jgi:hypothetical protein
MIKYNPNDVDFGKGENGINLEHIFLQAEKIDKEIEKNNGKAFLTQILKPLRLDQTAVRSSNKKDLTEEQWKQID